ncbi:MAG TPA: hypothetical protein VE997_00825 [Candidatus Limnocylindria bacterium]|jgi:hypothetical protein|nr:hypothetical protein [Candidatus Limnocylindria bacterium]
MPSTRPLAGLVLLAALAASCGGGSTATTTEKPATPATARFPTADSGTFARLARSIASGGPVLAPTGQDFHPGRNRFGFGLFAPSRRQITAAPAAVYVQSQRGGRVLGPYVAHAESLAVRPPYLSATVKNDPDAAKSLYVTEVDFPRAGKYNVLGLVRLDDRLVPTGTGLRVLARDPVPGVGDRPPDISTPTVRSVGGDVAKIDTRTPHDDMHDVDFRDAFGKRPIVLLFATPLLCQSRVCGPVTDVTEEVKHTLPEAKRVAFIHMEVYRQNDANKGYRPQLRAFHLSSEPWLFVIDRSGRVAARIEGAFSARELESAIRTALRQ